MATYYFLLLPPPPFVSGDECIKKGLLTRKGHTSTNERACVLVFCIGVCSGLEPTRFGFSTLNSPLVRSLATTHQRAAHTHRPLSFTPIITSHRALECIHNILSPPNAVFIPKTKSCCDCPPSRFPEYADAHPAALCLFPELTRLNECARGRRSPGVPGKLY